MSQLIFAALSATILLSQSNNEERWVLLTASKTVAFAADVNSLTIDGSRRSMIAADIDADGSHGVGRILLDCDDETMAIPDETQDANDWPRSAGSPVQGPERSILDRMCKFPDGFDTNAPAKSLSDVILAAKRVMALSALLFVCDNNRGFARTEADCQLPLDQRER